MDGLYPVPHHLAGLCLYDENDLPLVREILGEMRRGPLPPLFLVFDEQNAARGRAIAFDAFKMCIVKSPYDGGVNMVTNEADVLDFSKNSMFGDKKLVSESNDGVTQKCQRCKARLNSFGQPPRRAAQIVPFPPPRSRTTPSAHSRPPLSPTPTLTHTSGVVRHNVETVAGADQVPYQRS